jgi:DnaK suppressor protein
MKKAHRQIRQTLVDRRNEILDLIGSDSSALNQLRQDQTGDVVDFARGSALGEISSQLAEVEFRELKNIESAIARIQQRTYGICEGCEKAIHADRLAAIPHTMHCIACQRAAEDADIEPSDVTDWSSILDHSSPTIESGIADYGVNLS